MRALAALRWVNGRNTILQGQRAHAGLSSQLQAVDSQLQTVSLHLTEQPRPYPRHFWVEGDSSNQT